MPSVKCLLGTCDLQPQASQVALYTQTSSGMGKLFFRETVPTNLPGSYLFDSHLHFFSSPSPASASLLQWGKRAQLRALDGYSHRRLPLGAAVEQDSWLSY